MSYRLSDEVIKSRKREDVTTKARLVRQLLEQGMTQQQISEATGISSRQVSRYAMGKAKRAKRAHRKRTTQAVFTAAEGKKPRSIEWYKDQLHKAHMMLLENGLITLEVEL